MKNTRLYRVVVALVAVVFVGCGIRTSNPVVSQTGSSPQSNTASAACRTQVNVVAAIDKLSSEVQSETELVRKSLIHESIESPACRAEVVNGLIQAMNKPNLNFVFDRRSFYLWSNGSVILGELKAVEALDLLIEHLDLNDGEFSASMSHQPAYQGVTLMGVLAIPKLSLALQHKNQRIRLASALCLTEIDGPDAVTALENALKTETDQCVRRFIEISILILEKERSRTLAQSSTDELIDLRRKLLASFRCVS